MLETRKIATEDLKIGMFVSQLDRPWLGTPFRIQGFRLEDQEQIRQLQQYCQYVLVDTEQAERPTSIELPKMSSSRRQLPVETIFYDRSIKSYTDQSDFIAEHAVARKALTVLADDLEDMYRHVVDDNKLNVIRLKQSLEPLIGSISRNPDACLWVSRLKRHDQSTYDRSLSSGIWAVALGRELGLPRRDLRSLALGAMLMDVGTVRVRQELLQARRPLTGEEAMEVREHVHHGLDIIRASGIMNRDVLEMVAHHHERYNGSGYPQGLAEDRIPAFARIAAVVDTYGAITVDRGYAPAMSPAQAMRTLYDARDIEFQAELVEAFIRAIGIYPAGSVVELSNGAIAVVVAEYRSHRLRPTVLMMLDEHKRPLARPTLLKLQASTGWRKRSMPSIKRSLEPDAYGINLGSIDLHRQFGI